ncbi:MAG: hypothetical protein R6W90_16930 [Ignavibacteriaceae bacterium]
MLSNNFIRYFFIMSLCTIAFISCDDKNEPGNQADQINLNDPEIVLKESKKVLGNNVAFAYTGMFDPDTLAEVAAGAEIENKDEWGIVFYLLKQNDGSLEKEFQTGILEGSFNECLVRKIKFPSFNYELVYYNSQDYFLGSGGGEIFSYIIDYNNEQTYYAHLFTEAGQPVSLFLSENITSPEVKNFFISNFKRDYPSVSVVDKDVDLKY